LCFAAAPPPSDVTWKRTAPPARSAGRAVATEAAMAPVWLSTGPRSIRWRSAG